jgi:glycosyltransferase involved in cell wall biosynthesis
MVHPGETGLLITPGDSAALAEGLQALLDDSAKRKRMGTCARQIAERDFSAAGSVPRILDLMKECAARVGSAEAREQERPNRSERG